SHQSFWPPFPEPSSRLIRDEAGAAAFGGRIQHQPPGDGGAAGGVEAGLAGLAFGDELAELGGGQALAGGLEPDDEAAAVSPPAAAPAALAGDQGAGAAAGAGERRGGGGGGGRL